MEYELNYICKDVFWLLQADDRIAKKNIVVSTACVKNTCLWSEIKICVYSLNSPLHQADNKNSEENVYRQFIIMKVCIKNICTLNQSLFKAEKLKKNIYIYRAIRFRSSFVIVF